MKLILYLTTKKRDNLNQLKKSLSKLPAPKNDYEIVLPDEDNKMDTDDHLEMDRSDNPGEQYDIHDESELQLQRKQARKLKG